jgi:hypothetical protein
MCLKNAHIICDRYLILRRLVFKPRNTTSFAVVDLVFFNKYFRLYLDLAQYIMTFADN